MIIKNEQERQGLRQSGKRLAEVLEALETMVAPGVTSKALDDAAHTLIQERGGSPSFYKYAPKGATPFPGAICVSVNQGLVHGVPNEVPYTFKEGDIVKIDCGVNYQGFYTDSAITVGVGAIDPLHAELLAANREALEAQIEAAVAGVAVGDIGYAAQAVAEAYDFGYPTNLGGHGVGRAVHEKPFIYNFGEPGKGEKIVQDMVLALEPMFTTGRGDVVLAKDGWTYELKDGGFGAHFEHTVIVGEDGAEVLTRRANEVL